MASARESAPEIRQKIGLEHTGSEPVRLPDGQTIERHSWKVHDAGELAYSQMERRLSRSVVKETTLDYTSDFGQRHGIAEKMGVGSEIELRPEWEAVRRSVSLGERSVPAAGGRLGGDDRDHVHALMNLAKVRQDAAENKGEDLAQDLRADLRKDLAIDHGERRVSERQRRNPFEGLKLSRSAAAEGPQQDRAAETSLQINQKPPEQAERQATVKWGVACSMASSSTLVPRHITVLDLRTTGLLRLGVSMNATRAKSHAMGRRLSKALYDGFAVDGIFYASRLTSAECLCVYDRAVAAGLTLHICNFLETGKRYP